MDWKKRFGKNRVKVVFDDGKQISLKFGTIQDFNDIFLVLKLDDKEEETIDDKKEEIIYQNRIVRIEIEPEEVEGKEDK